MNQETKSIGHPRAWWKRTWAFDRCQASAQGLADGRLQNPRAHMCCGWLLCTYLSPAWDMLSPHVTLGIGRGLQQRPKTDRLSPVSHQGTMLHPKLTWKPYTPKDQVTSWNVGTCSSFEITKPLGKYDCCSDLSLNSSAVHFLGSFISEFQGVFLTKVHLD